MSKSVVLYLQLHQPYRIKQYTIFDAAHDHHYFNDTTTGSLNNQREFEKVAELSYRPMLTQLERALDLHPDFKFSLGLSGTFLDQAERWAPDIVTQLQRIVATGRVAIAGSTYYHSLAFLYSRSEFERQVSLHKARIKKLFNITPTVFCNTELAYCDDVASWAERRGYRGVMAEGWHQALGWRSANHIYRAAGAEKIALLLRNHQLSDDISLRFNDESWPEYPLTAQKFVGWAQHDSSGGRVMNLFMNIETFGKHQSAETGIFNFFDNFVAQWLASSERNFLTIDEAALLSTEGELSIPDMITWAHARRDMYPWTGNYLQQEVLRYVYNLENDVLQTEDERLLRDWRRLLVADLTYFMATPRDDDDGQDYYITPYDSPYDAFLAFMNAIRDIRWRIMQYRKGL